MKYFKDNRVHPLAPALVLMLGAYLLFAATFKSPWLVDDYPVILRNPAILSLASFFKNSHFMRPVRELSLMLDYKFFGFNSTGYHIQQIFWHGLNALLLFALALRIGLQRNAAWIAGLLFLAHPVHVEVVANISHRKDSLALAFALMSLLAYHQSFLENSQRWRWWLATALCMLLGFLAKGNIIVMPLILWLYETAFIPQEKRLLARYNRFAPLFALPGTVALITWYFHIWNQWDFRKIIMGAMIKMDNFTQFSQQDYFLMVLKSIAFMVSKLLWPFNLSMEYIYPVPNGWSDPWVIAALAMIFAAIIGLAFWRKTSKPMFFSLGWMLIFWVPTSNLFWYMTYFAADRYVYTPSAGFCLMLAVSYDSLSRRWPAKTGLLAAMSIVTFFALLTWRQNLVWTSDEKFFHHMLQVSPGSQVGIIGLTNNYIRQSKLKEALAVLAPALQADQFYVDPVYYNQAGLVYSYMTNYSTAIHYFKKADKKYRDNVEFHNNLASAMDKAGHYAEAEQVSRKAVALSPKNGLAHYNLGVSLYKMDRLKEAQTSFVKAAQLDPQNAEALYNLAVVQSNLGDTKSAWETLAKLRALDPVQAEELKKQLAEKK